MIGLSPFKGTAFFIIIVLPDATLIVPCCSPKSGSVERPGDRIRSFRDPTPERAVRGRSPSYFARSDRYRPDQNVRGTGRLESYRPGYDGSRSRQNSSSYRQNLDLGGRYRDSSHRRASSPNDSISSSRSSRSSASRSRSRSRSRSASRSSASFRRSPRPDRRSSSRPTGSNRLGQRRTKSRSTSRSSIASTQVSDHPPSRHVSPVTVPALNTSTSVANGAQTSPLTLNAPISAAPSGSRPASPLSSTPAGDVARAPSPIPGINNARAPLFATANKHHDVAVERDSQPPLESPIPAPGLGNNTLRDLDCDRQVEQQSEDLPRKLYCLDLLIRAEEIRSASPLTEEKPDGQPEIDGIVTEVGKLTNGLLISNPL
jgi:hypothetical protein